ncbi:L,D-transpeptidase family protein [Sulfitobacter sp. M57]|uniref:L,D-transpeptidase n=1 Tax=unclassified Sulfitobacter TaxID=196795 RepID=UPI0023E0FB1F|nr:MULTISPECIES: L,D-transpeptidase family protein [unclassified Sulfitobacter]MDF3412982.1 L,D-transpeptidase family protein [Sulfitobacter sp. KE5]MDF3421734.1 L,D-transpeptidase family protein [Sulfitobacter sp. KE43]MDF3431531.1 L,D-transpeptidase family protein [Sulfitobacter sp. KE42]MDF3457172.1 L,D-transpeptidase family protein [Sulfitobacter sp. S74]MDF3461075.1 L,D-transpeptidase family protein [Sulfitobacter sp. Ks18]
MAKPTLTRRALMSGGTAAIFAPSILRADTADQAGVRRNATSFVSQDWRDHFDTLGKSAIVADTSSRALHYWNSDASDYRVYPTSVPATEELTKRGYTKIMRKKVGPDWTPTASMMERFPHYKYMPPGPDNPLGTHAMYLGWPAYIIHGTQDTRKIGRRSSDGCIGLYNNQIEELFALCPVGTQVRII